MNKVLDRTYEEDVCLGLLEAIDDMAIDPTQAIPGLIRATLLIARQLPGDQPLDEAMDLLSDGLDEDDGSLN